jgi:hypothetical protein
LFGKLFFTIFALGFLAIGWREGLGYTLLICLFQIHGFSFIRSPYIKLIAFPIQKSSQHPQIHEPEKYAEKLQQ